MQPRRSAAKRLRIKRKSLVDGEERQDPHKEDLDALRQLLRLGDHAHGCCIPPHCGGWCALSGPQPSPDLFDRCAGTKVAGFCLHGVYLGSEKVRVCRSQDERSFSACRTAVRRYLRPARAGSAAAITPSAPVMLHVLSASTQLGAHRRPACTTQHVRYR